MSLNAITELSNSFGGNSDYVLAGGGNTSFKDENFLYVKPSGVSLSLIKPEDFVKMDRAKVRSVFETGKFDSPEQREAAVKKILLDAVAYDSSGRPSVEAPLHEIMPFAFVVHLHPGMVNGMTCGKDGKKICGELFPDALWVDYVDPGFTLAKAVYEQAKKHKAKNETDPKVIFLQNHGVFVGADSPAGIATEYTSIMSALKTFVIGKSTSLTLDENGVDIDYIYGKAPELRTLLGDDKPVAVTCLPYFKTASGPLTPDHIVYAKSFCLECDNPDQAAIAAFEQQHGYKPKVISVPGKVVFCAGDTLKDALTVGELAKDAARVLQLTKCFGGCNYLSDASREFIENWEVESYRKQVAAGGVGGSLNGKIALVTGGAQGFGFGIARELAAAGAVTAIADLNLKGAENAAAEISSEFGKNRAFALEVNIGSESSVEAMYRALVLKCGGIDLLVANAGVLRAGSVKDFSKKDWDFVTGINYTGYFLCAKHAANIMSAQNRHGDNWTDIIQVNSKSGLVGSNRNGAYAGSKFGTIGLTQSFALELVDDKIKVNSVCPGNFFDGPLWSDPERGLFVQYLNSNKVPGAKTLEDVKKFYESKIPMNRGCFPADVAKAIIYAVSQQYETGQAIPVTGGQVMLN